MTLNISDNQHNNTAIMLSVIMQNVVIVNVFLPKVVAPNRVNEAHSRSSFKILICQDRLCFLITKVKDI
jgi:hypothetical protein